MATTYDRIDLLEMKLKIAEDALRIYADEANWRWCREVFYGPEGETREGPAYAKDALALIERATLA
jgi:hypothetical protein